MVYRNKSWLLDIYQKLQNCKIAHFSIFDFQVKLASLFSLIKVRTICELLCFIPFSKYSQVTQVLQKVVNPKVAQKTFLSDNPTYEECRFSEFSDDIVDEIVDVRRQDKNEEIVNRTSDHHSDNTTPIIEDELEDEQAINTKVKKIESSDNLSENTTSTDDESEDEQAIDISVVKIDDKQAIQTKISGDSVAVEKSTSNEERNSTKPSIKRESLARRLFKSFIAK